MGNKTYEHYNEMGRYVDQRLEELGGERIYVRGEGDDDAKLVIVGGGKLRKGREERKKKERERERERDERKKRIIAILYISLS